MPVLNKVPDTFRENSTLLIDEIVGPINEAGVKFSSTYGVRAVMSFRYKYPHSHYPLLFRITITKRTSRTWKS